MSLVPLGPGRIAVSRVTLGCMWSGGLREPEIARLIHAAPDHGITSLDTAPLYAFHGSEEIVGRALAGRRDRYQVLTKAGLRWDSDHGRTLFEFNDASGVRRAVRKDSRPSSLRQEVEASLRRLRIDVIDLMQIHHPDVDTPIADSLGELQRMRDAGLIRAIGVSNYSAPQFAEATRALGEGGLDAVQCEYSLLERWAEQELLPACVAKRVGVLAYSPLAKGVLAGLGRTRDRRLPRASRGSAYGRTVARTLTSSAASLVLGPIAHRHGVRVAEVALAWTLAQPGLASVVVGASTLAQLETNAAAANVSLSADEMGRIGMAFGALRPFMRGLRRLGV